MEKIEWKIQKNIKKIITDISSSQMISSCLQEPDEGSQMSIVQESESSHLVSFLTLVHPPSEIMQTSVVHSLLKNIKKKNKKLNI